MKNIKNLALIFVMSLSLTSCLNSDPQSTASTMEIVKIKNPVPLEFLNARGITLIADQSREVSGKMQLVYYEFDTYDYSDSDQRCAIKLLSDPMNIDGPLVHLQAATEEDENAPIITLEPTQSTGAKVKGGFFDESTLVLPIVYKTPYIESVEEAKAERQKHSFTIFFDPENGVSEDGTVVTLVLAHELDQDGVERNKFMSNYKAYNIMPIFNSIGVEFGKVEKFKVVTKINDADNDLSKAEVKEYTYKYDFNKE